MPTRFHIAAAGLLGAGWTAAAQEPAWSLSAAYRDDAAAALFGQTHAPRRYTFELARRLGAEASAFWRHEYRALALPAVGSVAADSNGHVHRSALGWRFRSEQRRIEIAPTVAASSNVLKNPGELRADDLRLVAAIEQRVGAAMWIALHADDRFGRSRVYPGLAFEFRPSDAHELRLGFPDAAWHWHAAPTLMMQLAAGPDGGRWQVRDPSLTRRSDIRVRAWGAQWTVRWQPVAALAIDATVGRRFGTELRYLVRDGTTARVDVPDRNYFGVGAALRF